MHICITTCIITNSVIFDLVATQAKQKQKKIAKVLADSIDLLACFKILTFSKPILPFPQL